jgi:uncharacterized membrane protein YkvA (DUF1232 family)
MDLLQAMLGVVLLAAAAWLVLVAIVWLHRPSREIAGPVLRLIPDLVRLVRSLLADPTTPRSAKVGLGGLLAYLISPIDLVPDFIPVIGSLDDIVILALVLRWAGRRVGAESLQMHWTGSTEGFAILRRLLGM